MGERLTDKELQELEALAKELEELEFEVGGQDEDADAVLERWKEYRKKEGYDEDSEYDDYSDATEEEDDPHKYDGRTADPILEKSVDQLLEEDRRRWEEQEKQWQEQEKKRQDQWKQQQLLWQQQEEALATGTYQFTDYGAFGSDPAAANSGALVVAGQGQGDMYGYGDYGYGDDMYADYYAYTYDIDMSEFDTEEYIRLYQEALALLEAQQKALEDEEERRKKLEVAKKNAAKEEEKKKAEEAGGAKEDDDDSSEPEDSDDDVDDEEIFARMLANKEKMKKLAEQRAKVMLLGRAGKIPSKDDEKKKKKKKKKKPQGKLEASAALGLKVDAKTGKLRVPQANGKSIKINLKDAESIKQVDGGCMIVMPHGFELTIKSKSRLAPRLKEIRDALLAKAAAAPQAEA